MAIVSIPLLGRASGKMSNFEFYRLTNRNCIRSSKLKRYKNPSVSQSYRQILLKKIVSSVSPIIGLLRLSYYKKRSNLNFFNNWLRTFYKYFYLNESDYLFFDDFTVLKFSIESFFVNASFSVSSYSGEMVFIDYISDFDFYSFDYEIYAVLITPNFRNSCFFMLQPNLSVPNQLIMDTGVPPFHSSDYSCFIFVRNFNNNQFSNTIYAFDFSH